MANTRGKIFVDKAVQGALAQRIICHWCAFFLLAILCLFVLEYFLGDPNLTMFGHLQAIWHKYAFFVLLMLTIIPSFIYDAMKLSHRFAGPMVRLKACIAKLANGEDVNDLHFRDGDFWKDVSQEFNRLAKRLREEDEVAV